MVMQLYFFQARKSKLEVWKSPVKMMLTTLSTASWSSLKAGTLLLHATSFNYPFWILVDSCKLMKEQIFQDGESKVLLRCLPRLKGHGYSAILLSWSIISIKREEPENRKMQGFSHFTLKAITLPSGVHWGPVQQRNETYLSPGLPGEEQVNLSQQNQYFLLSNVFI